MPLTPEQVKINEARAREGLSPRLFLENGERVLCRSPHTDIPVPGRVVGKEPGPGWDVILYIVALDDPRAYHPGNPWECLLLEEKDLQRP